MSFDAAHPFNALPSLPPKAKLETTPALKACIAARAALAELKALGSLIPNQAILINSIPLLEAQASSEIENIVTTGDRLFRFADAPNEAGIDPATKETLRYRTASAQGFASLASRPLSTRTAIDVCSTIKGVDMDVRRVPGTALANDRTGAVVYTPPEGEQRLRDLLANWESWLHEHGDLARRWAAVIRRSAAAVAASACSSPARPLAKEPRAVLAQALLPGRIARLHQSEETASEELGIERIGSSGDDQLAELAHPPLLAVLGALIERLQFGGVVARLAPDDLHCGRRRV